MPENEAEIAANCVSSSSSSSSPSSSIASSNTTPPAAQRLVTFNSGSFALRRQDIHERLIQSGHEVLASFQAKRKLLATEKDESVAELLQALEDAFNYGLFEQPQMANAGNGISTASVAASAQHFLHNMQEIVIGTSYLFTTTEFTFWDFCQLHMTAHEKQRYEQLKHIWTKCGQSRAFIRGSLNEHSLQRYLQTWLADVKLLRRHYSPYALLCDEAIAQELCELLGSLSTVLFALTVDTPELNVANRKAKSSCTQPEPIIEAPAPVPVLQAGNSTKSKSRVTRTISPSNSINEIQAIVNDVDSNSKRQLAQQIGSEATEELAAQVELPQTEPIGPYLEFLKEPLPSFNTNCVEQSATDDVIYLNNACLQPGYDYDLDRSDTSSQYSKTSSNNANNLNESMLQKQVELEQRLQHMNDRCASLETQIAKLSLENRQLVRKLKQSFLETGINPNSSLSSNFLITIPQVQLQKSRRTAASSHYVYDVHITMRQHMEHWSVQRRYSDFYKLHKSLLKTHPSVSSVHFPPKKHFGNMNTVFVEERRQQLQIYLLNLMECLPQVESCKSKQDLQKTFPFLRER